MAVQIPTIIQLYNDILNDIATEFGVDVNDLGVTYQKEAKVQAAKIYTAYLALSAEQKNVFYDLAEESVLIRYGSIILGRKPAPAEAGEYSVEVKGTIGATIPASTTFRANDNTLAAGYLFVVDSEFILSATTDYITVRALEPGIISALYIDDLVTSTAPIVNVDSEGKVTAIAKQPVAKESIASYRADVIQASQIEPQGGSPGDYRLWTLDVPEVRTSYWFAKDGEPGNIQGYIEATKENTAPAEIVGIPTQETLDEVYTPQDGLTPESGVVVINETTGKGRRPIGVSGVEVLPVNPLSVDIYLIDLSDESIAATLKANIETLLYNKRPFVAGADIIINKNDILTIGEVIAVVIQTLSGTGISYTNLTMQVDNSDVSSYQFLLGNYPYLRFLYNNGAPI